MKDYVQIYGEAVRQFRELNQKAGPKLRRQHVWPKSLGGKKKDED